MVSEYDGPYNKRFYDCTILVILFTTLVQVGFLTCFSLFFDLTFLQGIVAKPLVETLQLKKDKERNPKIRETQLFQEFQEAVNNKVKSIYIWLRCL